MKKLSILILSVMLALLAIFSSACGSKTVQPTSRTTTQAPLTTSSAPRPTLTFPATTTRPPATTTGGPPVVTPIITVTIPPTTSGPGYPVPSPTGTIGLSTGGAKDIANFRENIRNNFLPLPTDITYEGLFYDYYFDTGAVEPTNKLYSPSYSSAVTRDPFSKQTEYYLSVGLNSGLKESDFQRKKLNLVIVLDTSGSMNEQYNQYYYDRNGKQVDAYLQEGAIRQNKMDSANESAVNILNQLNFDDWFSIVTFNSQAKVFKEMSSVGRTDMGLVKDGVLDLMAGGSTNLDAGLDAASTQLRRLTNLNTYEYENRVIVLTDAEPNTGDFSSSGFLRTLDNNARSRIYTTFIGVGVDFNSALIEQISKIKGCNYYSVHSPRQFKERIDDEFEFMVTPLVFDLELKFESKGWRIEKVFGSPQADESSGRLMRIDTLFASKSDENGQVKGGLVLLKLKKTSAGNESIYLRTTYEDRAGRSDGDTQIINLETVNPEYFDNSGIRKGILLTRYAALLKNWMAEERQYATYTNTWKPGVREDTGIILPVDYPGQWERQSMSLKVSSGYNRLFEQFSNYFISEMQAIGDNDLNQELDILDQLVRH